jgi:hypothetical protein
MKGPVGSDTEKTVTVSADLVAPTHGFAAADSPVTDSASLPLSKVPARHPARAAPQVSSKNMVNLFEFKSARNLTKPTFAASGLAATLFDSDDEEDFATTMKVATEHFDRLEVHDNALEEWGLRNPEFAKLYAGMTTALAENLKAQQNVNTACIASRVHINILPGMAYEIRVDGVMIMSGNKYELAAELNRCLVKGAGASVPGTLVSIKKPAGALAPRPALYVNGLEVQSDCTPLGTLYDVSAPCVWLQRELVEPNPADATDRGDAGERSHHRLRVINLHEVAGRVAVFQMHPHSHKHTRIDSLLHTIHACFQHRCRAVVVVHCHLDDLGEATRCACNIQRAAKNLNPKH